MKKFFLMAGIAAFFIACNNDAENSTSVEGDTTNNAANSPSTYKASDGDVSYRNGKVVVWRDNDWVETDEDVKLENGTIVRRNGEVERDGKVVVLKDGEVVDRTGRFFDRAGNAIENAWQDVKEGAKDVKDEVKDIINDDDNN
jgi:hypothetical protein